ncbi:zinc finger protein [Macleaya cordata]|uniref:RBR-type E3 ubiquitin transferase n=1 Tax=Macleaya cordata TaxID=56857 RepID=A0A200QT56_MACCD|nr:zinc finger protein [Macleaya cordata]
MDHLSSSGYNVDDQEEMIINSSSSCSTSSFFFTCEICIEPIPLNQEFKNYNNNPHHRHYHHHHFCSGCIAKYIEVKVEDYSNATEVIIKCPSINCDMVLDPLSCRSILPQRVFDRWCAVLCESAVLNLALPEGFSSSAPAGSHNRRRRRRRVYCPFPDCSELILNECGDDIGVTRTECPNCKKLFCFPCQIPWGTSHQCNSSNNSEMMMMSEEEINIRDRNDILLLEMVKPNRWARCPTCNHCIERTYGCAIITCRVDSEIWGQPNS